MLCETVLTHHRGPHGARAIADGLVHFTLGFLLLDVKAMIIVDSDGFVAQATTNRCLVIKCDKAKIWHISHGLSIRLTTSGFAFAGVDSYFNDIAVFLEDTLQVFIRKCRRNVADEDLVHVWVGRWTTPILQPTVTSSSAATVSVVEVILGVVGVVRL